MELSVLSRTLTTTLRISTGTLMSKFFGFGTVTIGVLSIRALLSPLPQLMSTELNISVPKPKPI